MTTNRRNAYSMVELILALATSTILLGGLGSAMILATKAAPQSKSVVSAALDAASAADQLATDLFTAHTITHASATVVDFQVADRNSDGCPERIRYEWTGVSGAPLRRTYNDGLPLTALADIREFEMVYDSTAVESSLTPLANESKETLLASNVAPKYRTDWPLTSTAWIGQFVQPVVPAGTTSWKITRVELLMKAHVADGGTNNGIARVELRYAQTGSFPTGALIADATILERELPADYLWRSIPFSSTTAIDSNKGVCIVVKWKANATALAVQYQNSIAPSGDDVLLTTTDGGSAWTSASNKALLYKIYGTVSGNSRPAAPALHSINSIQIKLRSGDTDASRVETTISLPNEPEVTRS